MLFLRRFLVLFFFAMPSSDADKRRVPQTIRPPSTPPPQPSPKTRGRRSEALDHCPWIASPEDNLKRSKRSALDFRSRHHAFVVQRGDLARTHPQYVGQHFIGILAEQRRAPHRNA